MRKVAGCRRAQEPTPSITVARIAGQQSLQGRVQGQAVGGGALDWRAYLVWWVKCPTQQAVRAVCRLQRRLRSQRAAVPCLKRCANRPWNSESV